MVPEHFALSRNVLVCEWGNTVATLVSVSEFIEPDKVVICSVCRKVVFRGGIQEIPIEINNTPDHLGDTRAALYREGKTRAALGLYGHNSNKSNHSNQSSKNSDSVHRQVA